MFNISQILTKFTIELKNNKNTNPHFEAEILLSHILKKPREFLLAHPEKYLTKSQITNYRLLINRRSKGEPIAYLIGHKEFYGLDFIVNKNVLVPRPETELMVEEALRITHSMEHVTLIDVGTGSGCVIVTLACLFKNYELKIKNYELFGIDISKKALSVAKQNAKLNSVSAIIKFIHGDLLPPIINNKKFVIRNSKFVILANLPYLTPVQIKNSPSIKHEPKLALIAGADGLKYYRQLFKQIKTLLNKTAAESPRGDSAGARSTIGYVLCEIDPSQKNSIKQLIKKELPNLAFKIKKDLKGHSRLVIINI